MPTTPATDPGAAQAAHAHVNRLETGGSGATVRLVGLLDSPYVRRVAIALQLMEVPFAHIALSVFRDYEAFAGINAVVKAPTLVCADGCVLMDSSLILQYAATLSTNAWFAPSAPRRSRANAWRQEGLALAAMDKAVQYVYETRLRPRRYQYEPWRKRVAIQLTEALVLLDGTVAQQCWDFARHGPDMAQVTSAVAWTFCQAMVPDLVEAQACPHLHRLGQDAERLRPFRLAAHGEAPYPVAAPAATHP